MRLFFFLTNDRNAHLLPFVLISIPYISDGVHYRSPSPLNLKRLDHVTWYYVLTIIFMKFPRFNEVNLPNNAVMQSILNAFRRVTF